MKTNEDQHKTNEDQQYPIWNTNKDQTKVDRSGPKWTKVDQSGPKWTEVNRNLSKRTKMDQHTKMTNCTGLIHPNTFFIADHLDQQLAGDYNGFVLSQCHTMKVTFHPLVGCSPCTGSGHLPLQSGHLPLHTTSEVAHLPLPASLSGSWKSAN